MYIYIYKTRLASNEIFSPSNKINREVGRAKDLTTPRYCRHWLRYLESIEKDDKSTDNIHAKCNYVIAEIALSNLHIAIEALC